MRRLVLVISALFVALGLWALPARPGGVKYVQPDGSTLEIFLHGDEWGHWVTDREGRLLDLDAQGCYRLSTRSLPQVRRNAAARSRAMQRRRAEMAASVPENHTFGTHRVLVLLIEFAEVSFSVPAPKTAFTNMLCMKGYDLGLATGSVWDYFNDNSHGQYNPQFDIYGPVKLSKNMASYGRDDAETGRDQYPGPELALVEAASLLDDTIDFSQYDEDGDGLVDMVLFYYAGYDQAEGGSSDAIWSHQWNVQLSSDKKARNTTLDGVKLGSYICTSELMGNSGAVMGGIGGTVHEFCHHLGLPDFYDTDGDENGYTSGLSFYSAMCFGMYNNSGNTPPYLNPEELIMLGWAPEDAIQELPDGEVTLPGILNRKAYKIPASTEGEYFLLECRDGSGWDMPLPPGLVIYHVDQSERVVYKEFSALELWRDWRMTNVVNAMGSHPCFYVVPSVSPAMLNYLDGVNGIPFPGSGNVTAFQPIDWEGVPTSQQLTGIRYAGGNALLTVRFDAGKSINGLVVDTAGEPLPGVTVRVEPSGPEAVTDADGAFFVGLADFEAEAEVDVSVKKEGYVGKTLTLTLKETGNNVYIMLRKDGEPEVSTLDKSNPSAQLAAYSATGNSLMGAVRYSADELAPYEGRRLSTVTFYPVGYNNASAVYVLVESGGQRILNHLVKQPVFSAWNTVDISEYDLRVPAGEEMYIGYGVLGGDYDHPLSCRFSSREDPTDSYYAVYSDVPVEWQPMKKYDLALSVTVSEIQIPTALADIGWNSIDPGSGEYRAGNSFRLRLKEAPSRKPVSVEWYYDGVAVSEPAVTLRAGEHTVEARLTYAGGSTEVLEMEINVL